MDFELEITQIKKTVDRLTTSVAVINERNRWILWIVTILLGMTGIRELVPAVTKAMELVK